MFSAGKRMKRMHQHDCVSLVFTCQPFSPKTPVHRLYRSLEEFAQYWKLILMGHSYFYCLAIIYMYILHELHRYTECISFCTWFSDLSLRFSSFTASTLCDKSERQWKSITYEGCHSYSAYPLLPNMSK